MDKAIQNHQLSESAMAHLLPLPPIPTRHPNHELVDQIMAMLLPAPVEAPAPEPVDKCIRRPSTSGNCRRGKRKEKSNKGSREIKKERCSSGAIKAANWLLKQKPGLYSMEDCLA